MKYYTKLINYSKKFSQIMILFSLTTIFSTNKKYIFYILNIYLYKLVLIYILNKLNNIINSRIL